MVNVQSVKINNMNYLTIGSIGFAQLGQDDYQQKRKIENKVLMELKNLLPLFSVPEDFKSIASINLKTFQHDFGSYEEMVVNYNDDKLDLMSDEQNNTFWLWTNELESFDFEQPVLLNYCERLLSGLDYELYTREVSFADGVIHTLQLRNKENGTT